MASKWLWDAEKQRFRNAKTKRLVPESEVRAAVDAVASRAAGDIAALTRRLVDGKLTNFAWERQVARVLKSASLAGGIVGQGGTAAMAKGDYGMIGRLLRDQYTYLHKFAADVFAGRVAKTDALLPRARMYAGNTVSTFEAVRTRAYKRAGYDEERNVLDGGDHCSLCPELSDRGWVPIDSLPPIGSRLCMTHDRCRLERRRSEREQAESA